MADFKVKNGLSASNTITSNEKLAVVAGTATTNATLFELKPTNYGPGNPRFTVDKSTTANMFNFTLRDSNNNNTGTINIDTTEFTKNGNKIWDAGNDGAGSGLDADLLDGMSPATSVATANTIVQRDSTGSIHGKDVIALGPNAGVYVTAIDEATTSKFYSHGGFLRFAGPIHELLALKNDRTQHLLNDGTNWRQIWHVGNDGSGSGLDADLLDGQDSSYYTNIVARLGYTPWHAGNDGAGSGLDADLLDGQDSSYYTNIVARLGYTPWHGGNDGAGSGLDADLLDGQDSSYYTNIPARLGYTPWHAGNDGAGSGLDADLLDGLSSLQFVRTDTNSTISQGNYFRFYHANQTDANDGLIGAGLFANGLNIVGVQTSVGAGRQTRLWGDLIDAGSGGKFWHAGNDGAGSGLDADLLDGQESSYYRNASNINAGTVPNDRLPGRLQSVAQIISNWDDAVENGTFMADNVANAPAAGWIIGSVEVHNAWWVTQTVFEFWGYSGDTKIWRRHRKNGTWENWYRCRFSEAEQDARYYRKDTVDYVNSGLVFLTNNNNVANQSDATLEVRGTGGAASIKFHRPGIFGAYFGLDTDNQWRVGSWSYGPNSYKLWHEGNDGAGSGLDADLLDGQDSSYYLKRELLNTTTISSAVAYVEFTIDPNVYIEAALYYSGVNSSSSSVGNLAVTLYNNTTVLCTYYISSVTLITNAHGRINVVTTRPTLGWNGHPVNLDGFNGGSKAAASTVPVNKIRFDLGSGINIGSGTFKLYGIK